MKILATVCARKGSKRLKNKNIRMLNEKPLIFYTINILKKWGKADRIICSTDSKEIAEVAVRYGAEVPFVRPANLATDETSKLPVLQHAVKVCEKLYNTKYSIIFDLDPTSPIRKASDLDNAFNLFLNKKPDVLYSVCKARRSPYFNMVELNDKGYAHLSKPLKKKIYRSQDSPSVYDMNASIYIYKRDFLLQSSSVHSGKAVVYIMEDIAAFDIDREIDFKFIEFLLEKGVFKFD